MWQFIVSGNVPGTSIQVTFDQFAGIVAIFAMLAVSALLFREHRAFHKAINDHVNHLAIYETTI